MKTVSNIRKLAAVAAVSAIALIHASAFDLFSSYLGGQTNQIVVAGTNVIPTVIYGSQPNYYDIPNNAHNTNNFPAIEFQPGSGVPGRIMPIQFSSTGSAASTANITLWFASSIDRQNWMTNALIWQFAMNGNNQKTVITNLDTMCAQYWCLTAASNASGTVNCTNIFLSASKNSGL